MARHSINDWRESLTALEGRDRSKFLKAHCATWGEDVTDKRSDEYAAYKTALDGDGDEFADYVLSFTASGKSELQNWLVEAAEKGLIDSPYEVEEEEEEEPAEEEEEEEEAKPARRQVAKKIVKKTSRRDDDEPTRGRGRPGLTEEEIEEIREVLGETQSISETSERTGRARATIMNYIPVEEREELGVRVWGSGKARREEKEAPRKRKVVAREEPRGRGRPSKEQARGRSGEKENSRGRSIRRTRD